jgi:hypothetical protein
MGSVAHGKDQLGEKVSELSFLLDLLLNEKLSKSVKEKLTARVKEIETTVAAQPINTVNFRGVQNVPPERVINGAVQSPSTIAAMQRQAQMEAMGPGDAQEVSQHQEGQLIASPGAAAAIASRNQALAEAMSGKPAPGRTSPKKF